MKQIKLLLTIIVIAVLHYPASAQELTVVSFEESATDLKARTEPRVDLNNDPCALVRVQIPTLENMRFSSSLGVVGNVEHFPGEYLVYLPKGTKKIVIKHPDFLPCTVSFPEFGINSLVGQTTYRLILGLPKNTGSTTIARFKTNVKDAVLEINGQSISTTNSEFDIPLSKGEYDYTISTSLPGFSPYSGRISISGEDIVAEIPKINLATDLSYNLTVYSDKEASVFIDGTLQNKNGIFSVILPAGMHTVESKIGADGRWYLKREKDLSSANDSIDIQMKGVLAIESPRNATFTITPETESTQPGKKSFKSGESIRLLGKYLITAKKKGYEAAVREVSVGIQDDLSHFNLQMTSNADILYHGLNGKKSNKSKAVALYQSMILSGDDQAMLSYGSICIDEGDWAKGYDLIRKAADMGNVAAMLAAYENARSDDDRNRYSEMAALCGNAKAMKFCAERKLLEYKKNHHDDDAAESLAWFMAAYEHGDNSVLCRIGDFHHNGWSVKQDYRTAYDYYSEAFAEKNAEAGARIGYYYMKGLGGLRQDEDKASSIFSSLIKNGQADDDIYYYASYLLFKSGNLDDAGNYLQKIKDNNVIIEGKEFTSDHIRALGKHFFSTNPAYSMSFYQTSLDMGNTSAESYLNIGKLYYLGKGTAKNVSQAVVFFSKAIPDNPKEAYYYLGLCQYNRKMYSMALDYFMKAGKEGHIGSYGKIGTMYYNGQGVSKSNSKAVEYWERAGARGDKDSIKNLIKFYEYKKDYDAANKWKRKLKQL